MSGDCKEQPVIFYSQEMTESKIFLLSRGRITKKGEFFLRNSINPPFQSKLNFKLEYIG